MTLLNTSNVFSLVLIDTLIFAAGMIPGFLLGRVGYTKLKADVESLKNIIYPQTVVTTTPTV